MDWQAVGVRIAPILTILLSVGAAVSGIYLIQVRRTARSTSFGYVREQSGALAKRLTLLLVALSLLAIASGALWGVSVRIPDLLPTPAPTVTQTPIPTPTPRPPTATYTPTSTPTITPTPTSTPVPPDAHLPSALRTPFPAAAVTPGPDATLVELVLAAGQENDRPINPGQAFPRGTEQVFAFLTFDHMARNVPWVHAWYVEVDGQLVESWSQAELWAYDAPWGFTWRYFNCRDGRYELHIYVGRRLVKKMQFTVGIE